ncbi:MAG TPA: hypothetical protein VGG39_00805 [Polyangiaceae bacterium]
MGAPDPKKDIDDVDAGWDDAGDDEDLDSGWGEVADAGATAAVDDELDEPDLGRPLTAEEIAARKARAAERKERQRTKATEKAARRAAKKQAAAAKQKKRAPREGRAPREPRPEKRARVRFGAAAEPTAAEDEGEMAAAGKPMAESREGGSVARAPRRRMGGTTIAIALLAVVVLAAIVYALLPYLRRA